MPLPFHQEFASCKQSIALPLLNGASNVHILHISINHLALSPAIPTYKRVNIKIVNISSALHIGVSNSSSRENGGKIVSEKCRQQRLGGWQVIAPHECVVDARRHASQQRYWQDDKNCVRNNVIYFKVRENFSSPCRRRRKKKQRNWQKNVSEVCCWDVKNVRCSQCHTTSAASTKFPCESCQMGR